MQGLKLQGLKKIHVVFLNIQICNVVFFKYTCKHWIQIKNPTKKKEKKKEINKQTQTKKNEVNLQDCQTLASPWPRRVCQRRATARVFRCGGEQRLAVVHATSDGEGCFVICTQCSQPNQDKKKSRKLILGIISQNQTHHTQLTRPPSYAL